jgi:signal transduction histidine kinase
VSGKLLEKLRQKYKLSLPFHYIHFHRLMNFTKAKFNFKQNLKSVTTSIIRNDLTLSIEDEVIKIELSILPIKNIYSENSKNNQKSFVVILRDITKEKTLEDERDEFISVVSHELRTPVAIAEGAISNLSLMLEKNSPKDKMVQSVQSTYSEIMFLANMINDLSTLSRAERGVGSDAEIIDSAQLGKDLFKKYQKEVTEKGLNLDLNLDPSLENVKTSRLYIEELLQNFITNAIKYTRKGNVLISIQNKDDKTVFSITDTGIGISKNDQQKIFNKFYRSEDYRTRETGGTGLGLYVASKLAKKINTKIELTSRLNHGSTFSFKLPTVKK